MNADKDIPVASRYYGSEVDDYDSIRGKKRSTKKDQIIVEKIMDGFARGDRILDIPVGTGRYMEPAMKRGLAYCGIDISADMLRKSEERKKALLEIPEYSRGICELLMGDARSIPLGNESCDWIISVKFIKWLPTLRVVGEVLKEFFRVCRKGAVVQVKLAENASSARKTNRNGLVMRLWRVLRQRFVKPQFRATAYSDREIREVLLDSGFCVESVHDNVDSLGRCVRFYVLRKVA